MAQDNEKKMPEINIGIVGHVDHGKTTLASALTGKWTMVHSEELKRGITIKLGYADAEIRKCPNCPEPDCWTNQKECPKCKTKSELVRKISIVDAPGHETLMAVMITGAAIMDGALLLVAANEECPQPQTSEHLMALKVLGIKNIIIIQNKVDLVTKEKAKKNYQQVLEYSKKILGFEVPVIPVSAQKKVNIDVILAAIQHYFKTPERDLAKDPILYVARSFDINKPGAETEKLVGGVFGGAIIQGEFKVGDEIEIQPGLKIEKKGGQVEWRVLKTKITGIVSGNVMIDKKGPGGSVAISTNLDPAVTKSDSLVGNVIGLAGKTPKAANALNMNFELFDHVIGLREETKIEPFKLYEPVMLNIGTSTTLGIVQRSAKNKMYATLRKPIVASKGAKAAISRQIQNRWRLIGFGVVQ